MSVPAAQAGRQFLQSGRQTVHRQHGSRRRQTLEELQEWGKPSDRSHNYEVTDPILVITCSLLASPLWAADSISISELKQAMQTGKTPIIIDVRDEDEYLAGHIPGAILVPAKNVEHHLDMLEKYKRGRDRAVLPVRSSRQCGRYHTGKRRVQACKTPGRRFPGLASQQISRFSYPGAL